ncbi:hypothetical protein [Geomicrobium sediminis]|uniref:SurA N-terminal domain-containing protein n=1 Tax=Geomicrobium sediminis TaxID=1347788 RepID=A0ABS2PFV2_9BACL|nr:hypothetical protein [Geomicrobium sediminis]MBM7634298.1 hypothetical protein [Geomicrobium sediminis]
MRKTLVAFSIIGLIVFGSATTYIASGEENNFNLKIGQSVQENLFSDNNARITSSDEGSVFELDEFNQDMHHYLVDVVSYRNKEDQSKEAINDMAFNMQLEAIALRDKAKKLDVLPSDEEIDDLVKGKRAMMEGGVNADGNEVNNHEEAYEELKEVIEGMGLTEDQYWNEYVPEAIMITYTSEKVKNELVNTELNKEQSVNRNIEELENRHEEWNSTKDEIVQNYINENKQEVDEARENI